METKTISLFNPQCIRESLERRKKTTQVINDESFPCPFCEDGTLQVADCTHDPQMWLCCKSCKGQVRLTKRVPEPILETRDDSGEWEINRITTDRDARTW